MRVAVVSPIPTPYRDGFWNVVAALPDVELDVFYCAAGKADRPWAANWERRFGGHVIPGINLIGWWRKDSSVYWNRGVKSRLRKGRYDAVLIGGYNHLTMWSAMRFCGRHGVPYFLMWETHEIRRSGGLKGWLREKLIRRALAGATGAFPTGTLATKFLEHYGLSRDRQMSLPNMSDVESLAERVKARRGERKALREKHGLDPELPTVVFVGRLIPMKRARDLIAAVARANEQRPLQLLVVGDGDERSALEQKARESACAGRIRFAGFLEPEQIDTVYALADIFVLPSHETWGVVVLEALAAGLKVLVSDRVGCHADVRDHATVFAYGEVEELAGKLVDAAEECAGPRYLNLPEGWSFPALATMLRDFIGQRIKR